MNPLAILSPCGNSHFVEPVPVDPHGNNFVFVQTLVTDQILAFSAFEARS